MNIYHQIHINKMDMLPIKIRLALSKIGQCDDRIDLICGGSDLHLCILETIKHCQHWST